MEEYDLLRLTKAGKPSMQEALTIERFLASIESHVTEEEKFLHEYTDAILSHKSPIVHFVLQLILSDEEKHHGMLKDIAARLRSDLDMRDRNLSMREIQSLGQVDAGELRRLTDRFLHEEREGIKEMKALMKYSANFYDGLVVMVLGMLIKDSEKHILMLEFLRSKI